MRPSGANLKAVIFVVDVLEGLVEILGAAGGTKHSSYGKESARRDD